MLDHVDVLHQTSARMYRPTGPGRIKAQLCCLIIMLFVVASASFGQETRATLGGKVFDAQGAAINGATVTVTAEATNVTQTTTTNGTGNWQVQYLVPGSYHFQVVAPGFKKMNRAGIELQIGDQKFIDITLGVGSATEEVTVEATTPLIDTTAAVSGTVITTDHLQELPSQSSVATLLVGLTPGAIVTASKNSAVRLWSNSSASNMRVNGSGWGQQSMNYTLDGATNTNDGGQVAFVPPMEALSEFKVVTNAYDASLGSHTGATVNMSLKSGTRKFHGSVYEKNQNNTLNANYYENKANNAPVPPMHSNEWGGTFGGPVLIPKVYDGRKKQTFFFFTYDGIRNNTPGTRGFMSLPTMLERTGDFSQSFTTSNGKRYPITIYDPSNYTKSGTTVTRAQFVNNTIPANRISPIAAAYLKLLPEPDNDGDGTCSSCKNFVKRSKENDKFVSFASKFDQAWNNAHHSYVSLRYNNFSELSFDNFGSDNPLQGLYQARTNKGITVDHAWLMSPKFLLDLRYNLTVYENRNRSNSAGVDPTQLGFPSSYAALMSLPSLPLIEDVVGGVDWSGLGTNQVSFGGNRFHEFGANLTQTSRNHTLHYGVLYTLQQKATAGLGFAGGMFNFANSWTTRSNSGSQGVGVGSNLASFLLGLPTGGYIPKNGTGMWSQHKTGLYVQDDWRATNKLTLNFGLRWDYQRPATERFNRFYTFDPTVNLTPITDYAQPKYATLLATSAGTNAGLQLIQKYHPDAGTFVARGGRLYAGVDGNSRYVENPRYKYIQPRFGFAYRLRNDTVIRGGVGRFAQATLNFGSQGGYSQNTTFMATNDNYATPLMSLSNLYPNGLTQPTGNSLGVLTDPGTNSSFSSRDIGRVFVDESSLQVQHQIGNYLIQVGGVLNITHDIGIGYNINLPSLAAWQAAYAPAFDGTGKPISTYAGDVKVNNPFLGAPYILGSLGTSKQVSAYQLLRPNPLYGDQKVTLPMGKSTYYALQTKVERRFKNGFSVMNSFTWSKRFLETEFYGPHPQIFSDKLVRQIDGADRPFLDSLTSTYALPFGRGKLIGRDVSKGLNLLIGGWEVAGIYSFMSGTPIDLPTNGSFYNTSCNPYLGSAKTKQRWFNTSCFMPFPDKNMTSAEVQAYPAWTGVQKLPGYDYVSTTTNGVYMDFRTWPTMYQERFSNIRTPFTNNLDLGVRKNIPINERVRMQLRMDAFNALNHPRFGGPSTDPSSAYFGVIGGSSMLIQQNDPRQVQLAARITF